ncbi:5'/3'-nucleotidase SurE [Roseiterribacter gracilis]|uniref:5'-nucleotidase SurE n=1 Tax=Roseiterribacter gracilis TaxID=2812848 RepID=A0A8S8X917_9PROT|nr:5'-nucleotidase SurE [Rhodospirillales bacterium TMPK1]
MTSNETPIDLGAARILLANDDGVHAEGLAVLERIARSLSDDVWVCAPETEQSAASHSLTISRPLRVRKLAEKRYAVDGTPTDCVLLAFRHLFKDTKPTLVLSGVNHGENLADDITYSGTVAAAMEATLLGVPAIAFSQAYQDGRKADFATAEKWGADVVRRACATRWDPGVLMNVNFPAVAPDAVTGIRVVRQGKRKLGDDLVERTDPRGRLYFWIGPLREEVDTDPETDIGVIAGGGISVTPLGLDLTHGATLQRLGRMFDQ